MKILVLTMFLLTVLLPVANAIIEEDWGKYTRIGETKRDSTGNNVTLSWLKRSYTNDAENYTVKLRDFDAQGMVVLDITYKGRNQMVILKGEWDANRTRIVTEPLEIFNKTMRITPNKIVPPAGVFTCCPETEINIDLIRPELYLEFNKDTTTTFSYNLVNPYTNWTYSPYISPYDNSTENVSITIEQKTNAFRMYEEIPMEIYVTNHGDAESQNTVVYIDTDGLKFEYGYPYYQLPTLGGKNQKNFNASSTQTIKLRLKFPSPPKKLNYTVQVYVKGVKEDITYYYDASKTITLLPSIGLQKSVTKESLLLNRKEVELIYPSLDPENDVYRWLQGGDIIVNLGVTNYQSYELKGITLSDTLHREFTIDNESLNWKFNLKPLETKEFKYTLKAKRPGNFKLPPSLLAYSELNLSWSMLSNTPSTQVHGPCVQVFKKSDKPVLARGENTTLTLTVRNSGDMPSRVKIVDILPENSTFLGGTMNYEGTILPMDSVIISYNLSIDGEGQIQLPYPGLYVNGRENAACGEPISSKILIKEPPMPTPANIIKIVETPVITPLPLSVKYSWLEGAIPALMLILAVMVLLILHRANR